MIGFAIDQLGDVSEVLDELDLLGPTACAGCDPNWIHLLTAAERWLEETDAVATIEFAEPEWGDPDLVSDFAASVLALQDQLAELQAQALPLSSVPPPAMVMEDVRSHAGTLDRTGLDSLIQAIGRIRNGQIQPGDETTVHAMPHWQEMLQPSIGALGGS